MNRLKNSKLLKFGKLATRIAEIFCWLGVALTLICAVACMVNGDWTAEHMLTGEPIRFNDLTIADSAETFGTVLPVVITALLGGCISLALTAIMFHTMHKVLASAQTGSPFQSANVRRIERIGWLAIISPIVGWALTLLCKFILGDTMVEPSLDITGLAMGLMVLILSRFFAYGVSLQNDVDGLV